MLKSTLNLDNMASSEDAGPPKKRKCPEDKNEAPYAKSYSRMSKENLYMIIALWMEDFAKEAPKNCNKVGAVLVLPNEVIWAVDCSRDNDQANPQYPVHAVARLLMKHSDKAKGCKIFMSRKPCPTCAKLLVQSKVERVLFLPFEPEYYPSAEKDSMMIQVDSLFTSSAIAQTRFVLQVEKGVLKDAKLITPSPSKAKTVQINNEKKILGDRYGLEKSANWNESSIREKLPWPAFDTEIYAKFHAYFTNAMEWMARVLVLSGSGLNYDFERAKQQKYADDADIAFEQLMPNDPNFLKQTSWRKFIAIARFLAERTDDPKAGVGVVIVSQKMEILALGWNGFPLKALYGEYPRAADSDETIDKKGPYIIHAEQNALLMRNQKNIEGSTLFVAGRPPCNECVPLIAMQRVETVVVDANDAYDVNVMSKLKESYKLFPEMVKNNKFVCYRTKSTKKVTATKR